MVRKETKITDLARALLDDRGAIVGQFTMNLFDQYYSFADVPKPEGSSYEEMVVSAALVELFAARRGESAPSWTTEVRGLNEPRFLMGGYEKKYPYLADIWYQEAPEPLKRRNLFASADFLTFT